MLLVVVMAMVFGEIVSRLNASKRSIDRRADTLTTHVRPSSALEAGSCSSVIRDAAMCSCRLCIPDAGDWRKSRKRDTLCVDD